MFGTLYATRLAFLSAMVPALPMMLFQRAHEDQEGQALIFWMSADTVGWSAVAFDSEVRIQAGCSRLPITFRLSVLLLGLGLDLVKRHGS